MQQQTPAGRSRIGSPDGGFTLIETAIAAGILAVAAASIASLFISSARVHVRTNKVSTAVILASEKIEQLKASRNPSSGEDYASFTASGALTLSSTDSSLPFRRAWQLSDGPAKAVTVSVFDRAGAELIRTSTTVSPKW